MMPIKKISVLCIIHKQLFKRIFRAFSVTFCVSPWATEGYCAPSTHESLRPSFCCSDTIDHSILLNSYRDSGHSS